MRLALLCDYAGAAVTGASCLALFADGRGSSETLLLTAGAVRKLLTARKACIGGLHGHY